MTNETVREEFQQFFENGVTGCLKQGRRSTSKGETTKKSNKTKKSTHKTGIIKYRGANNCKCIIGFNIADRAYHKSIEGFRSYQDKVTNALINSNWTPDFLREYDEEIFNLQLIHDDKNPEEWYSEFKEFAKTFKLDSTFMDNLQVGIN